MREKLNNDLINLNIGGTHSITVKKSTLCSIKGSKLQKMFSTINPSSLKSTPFFVDRDGDIFKILITYLRNDFSIPPIEDKYTK